jgi:hypothetical protein
MATMARESRTLSISIERRPGEVYRFVADPRNFPKWAKGLCKSVRQEGGKWVIETPTGEAVVRLVEENVLGVLDHFVTVAPGVEVYVPMRVVANGGGSEVVFTLFRMERMSETQFAEDAGMVERDLATLKDVLETAR